MVGRKHTWKDFSQNYIKIVLRFEQNQTPLELSMTARTAQVQRRALYRFKDTLYAASSTDERANRLYQVIKNLNFFITPLKAKADDPATLVIKYHPLKLKITELFGNLD